MGRTLPSITQAFLNEQQSLARFRRALRREDQRALDDLLADARQHLAASAYASHLLPFEVMLLAMLVEEHKRVLHLETRLELLRREVGLPVVAGIPGPNRLPGPELSPDPDPLEPREA
jgi:hypothetical protein